MQWSVWGVDQNIDLFPIGKGGIQNCRIIYQTILCVFVSLRYVSVIIRRDSSDLDIIIWSVGSYKWRLACFINDSGAF